MADKNSNGNGNGNNSGRRRRSSSILQVYHEPLEPIEQLSDQSALPNLNAQWVNAKGTSIAYFDVQEGAWSFGEFKRGESILAMSGRAKTRFGTPSDLQGVPD
jgi:hypothetical protein